MNYEIESFDIRNFLDRLEPAKEKNKYICPVCDGSNLGINLDTGKYQCFNGCECKDIREKIRPWDEMMEENRTKQGTNFKPITSSSPTKVESCFKSVPLPKGELVITRLAEVPTDIPQPAPPQFTPKRVREKLLNEGVTLEELKQLTVISYDYGDNRKAHRYQAPCQASEKKHEKTFSISHVDETGKTNWNKGKYTWAAYRQSEAIKAALAIDSEEVAVILSHEGEKCVESARSQKLSGITAQGTPTEEDWVCILNEIKSKLGSRTFILAHCQDNDRTGTKKAETIAKAAVRSQVPFVAINLKNIYPDLCEKGDIADILASGMTGDELAQLILEEIKNAQLNQEKQFFEDIDDQDLALDGSAAPSLDPTNPESIYKPICQQMGLPFEDCVTATAFDTWVYHREFSGAQDWRVINSAFYKWSDNEQFWQYQPDNRINTLIADAGEKAFKLSCDKRDGWRISKPYGSNGHAESAFKYVRKRLERPDPLPTNTHLLGFRNCVVDLRTGQQMPHNKEYFLTNIIPYDYEPNKLCPEVFRQFIADSFGENMLEVVRAFTSMFLDPTAPYGRFPHLIGQSGGGKGTLGRVWSSLFGEGGSGSAAMFSDLASPEGRHQYLTGKRIFGFPDVGGYAQGVRAFYELVDNGPMTGRALFNSVAYSKQWYMRFWLASVDHLQIENAGDGWMRRAYPIPVKSRTVKPDPDLRLKLETAKADIISWALAMPREERDRILLSPPESEQAINLALDAALYGDSTKSFVDLCLRPSQDSEFVPHYKMHNWYVAYCREHGYTPLGMSKFISHLKTVLPRNFQDRHWTPKTNGKRERIPAHWKNIVPLPNIFVSSEPGINNSDQNPLWFCVKSRCEEGGLLEFEDFWQPKSPEPSPDGGVQGVQGTLDSKKEGGQAETTQNQGCPPCPPVQGRGKVIEIENLVEDAPSESLAFTNDFDRLSEGGPDWTPWTPAPVLGSSLSTPQKETLDKGGQAGQSHQDSVSEISFPEESCFDSKANAALMRLALENENSGAMLLTLLEGWSKENKAAVRSQLKPSEVEAIRSVLKNYKDTSTKSVSDAVFDEDKNAHISAITQGMRVKIFMPSSSRNGKTGVVDSLAEGSTGMIARIYLDDTTLSAKLRWISIPVPGNDDQRLEII